MPTNNKRIAGASWLKSWRSAKEKAFASLAYAGCWLKADAGKSGGEAEQGRGKRREQRMRSMVVTAWGAFGLEASPRAVTSLYFPGCFPDDFQPNPHPSPLLQKAELEIAEYFAGSRTRFSIPLEPGGSEFMQAVWRELCLIPFGQRLTYGQVAARLGNVAASRAVGMACARNPLSLLIPCHRVVGTGNKLTGFSAGGVAMKQRLLDHEGNSLFARAGRSPSQFS